MKEILVIQSRTRPEMVEGEQEEYVRALEGTEYVPVFKNALDESIQWNNPQQVIGSARGVIFGGSGEYDFDGGRSLDDPARSTSKVILAQVTPLLEYLFQNGIPTLGICYGHQIIGDWRGGKVANDHSQKKTGSHEVVLTEAGKNDPLFADMPPAFLAQYGHKDSLTTLPEGAVSIATGAQCNFSGLRYGPGIYTLQFHPELTASDVSRKLKLSPGYLPEGVDPTDIIRESPEASTLIARFVELIAK
ncbi:gamma-glutamyl-gamma-aminobutyrate hydrolase family protein [Patescibacteria group bacterium]|nr:gamma-glutamyl-gamma-aminobutyrate hydrolase family protein [Patescibacteria group bacterium]MBU2159141.1 gamma-glutamyl-gamma-aminobutyrate hydrolase family protein [Patescibacteria group bacterium]MBU2220491.1 gamma-glutamyl-gamma-aminobutyrate hydrolase family protein [Patescibacteria group bacterium]